MIFAAPVSSVGTRGRGLQSSAARFFLPLAAVILAVACGVEDGNKADNSVRSIVATADSTTAANCATLPDTIAELAGAKPDRNDLPDTQILLDPACPRASVLVMMAARLPRTYRVQVKKGQMLVARARGELAPVVLSFDYPALPRPDSSNVGRTVVDSIKADADREVAVRVMLNPRIRVDPSQSQVLLTVLVRP